MGRSIVIFSMMLFMVACGSGGDSDDRYIVVTNESYLKNLYGDEYNENGQCNINKYSCVDGRCYYVVTQAKASQLINEGNAVSMEKDVVYVLDEPDEAKVADVAAIDTNDPRLSSQWSLLNSTVSWTQAGTVFQAIDDTTIGYAAAVIDTGFNVHEDQPTFTTLTGEDAVDCYDMFEQDHAHVKDCRDDFGHGSHVAGIVAADTNNGIGIASASYGKTALLAVRASEYNGKFYGSDVLRALGSIYYRCKKENYKISVVNMSFGGSSPTSAHYEIIQNLGELDIAVVVAAGNDNLNLANNNEYPSNYNLNNIITVASLSGGSSNVLLSYYSNYGGVTDIAAPGGAILSFGMENDYVYKSGTSMAAPFITGLLAAGKNAAPNLTMGQLVNIMYDTAYKSSDLIGKVRDGNVVDAGAFMQKIDECKATGCTEYSTAFPARIYRNPPNAGSGCSISGGTDFSLTIFIIALAALALRRIVRRKAA